MTFQCPRGGAENYLHFFLTLSLLRLGVFPRPPGLGTPRLSIPQRITYLPSHYSTRFLQLAMQRDCSKYSLVGEGGGGERGGGRGEGG